MSIKLFIIYLVIILISNSTLFFSFGTILHILIVFLTIKYRNYNILDNIYLLF